MSKKKIWIIVCIVLLGLGFVAMKSKKQDVLTVKVSTSKKVSIQKVLTVSGILEAQNSKRVSLPANQTVTKVYVKEGDRVSEGQLLAETDQRELLIALEKLKLQQKNAQLSLSASVGEAYAASLRELSHAIDQATLNLELSIQKQSNAADAYVATESQYQAGQTTLEELNAKKIQLQSAQSSVESNRIALKNANNKLQEFKTNQADKIRLLDLEIQSLQNKLADAQIKAPLSGTLVEFSLKENEIIHATNDKATVEADAGYLFAGEVLQEDVLDLAIGNPANIKIRGREATIAGKVSRIKDIAQTEGVGNNLIPKVRVEISINEKNEKMAAGFEGDANILTASKKEVMGIPLESIRKEPGKAPFVFVVKDNQVVQTTIQQGLSDNQFVEVLEGLKPEESFVLNPGPEIKDKISVKTQP